VEAPARRGFLHVISRKSTCALMLTTQPSVERFGVGMLIGFNE